MDNDLAWFGKMICLPKIVEIAKEGLFPKHSYDETTLLQGSIVTFNVDRLDWIVLELPSFICMNRGG